MKLETIASGGVSVVEESKNKHKTRLKKRDE